MPLRTVVCLLDGSPLDRSALRHADALMTNSSRLVLVRATPDDGSIGAAPVADDDTGEARRYLEDMASSVVQAGEVDTAVFRGGPVGTVVEETFLAKGDLVIVALSAHDGLGHGITSGIAGQLLTRSPVPVLFVRPGDEVLTSRRAGSHARILVPLDGSAFAESALEEAAQLASCLSWDITLIQAVPAEVAWSPGDAVEFEAGALEVMLAEARHYLRVVAQHFAQVYQLAIPRTDVRAGEPDQVIVEASHERAARLVVMATHAHTGWRRLLIGSVTDKVLRGSAVPLVLMRPQARPAILSEVPGWRESRA